MDSYLGMIYLWAGMYVPVDFLPCDGRLLSIQEYAALYAVLGITYGGDARTNFALPDLRSRVPVGTGQGPGLSAYSTGNKGGEERVQLLTSEMPQHYHEAEAAMTGAATATVSGLTANGSLPVSSQPGTSNTPAANAVPAQVPDMTVGIGNHQPVKAYGAADNTTQWPVDVDIQGDVDVQIDSANINVQVGVTGGSNSHENRQPYIALNYIICVNGLFPPRP